MFDEDKRHGEKPVYTLSNPHPLHGKDPNIMNELGHTHFPKFIEHPTEKEASGRFPLRVLVADAEEEAEVLGHKGKTKAKDWGKAE